MKKNNLKIVKIYKNKGLFNYEKKNSYKRSNTRFKTWILRL